MDCERICTRVLPNAFVVAVVTFFGVVCVFYYVPALVKLKLHPMGFSMLSFGVIFCYAMWMWCWGVCAMSDPGRTRDDLARRGLLRQIEAGEGPDAIRYLRRCKHCGLPKPAYAHHCKTCGACFLRHDHHCNFLGQCIADKNFKAFVLMFIYGGIYSALISVAACWYFLYAATDFGLRSLTITIYTAIFGIVSFGSGIGIAIGGLSARKGLLHRAYSFREYIQSFGDSFFAKLIPLQTTTTNLAWPDEPLL